MVMGWTSGGVGYHTMSIGTGLSYKLGNLITAVLFFPVSPAHPVLPVCPKIIQFFLISMFCGHYLYFVDISVFCGYYPHIVDVVDISTFHGYYLYCSNYELLSL